VTGPRLAFALCVGLSATVLGAPITPTPKPKATPRATPAATPRRVATPSAKAIAETAPQPPLPSLQGSTSLRPAEIPEAARSGISEEAQRLAKRATAAFEKGELTTAQHDFEQVLVLAPGNPAASINLGLIAYRQKRFTAAETLLRNVVRSSPDVGLPWLILGIIYYEQEKDDAALAALAQAVYLEPKDARAHHYLGVSIGRRGWYSGAEDEMRKAIELQPDYSEAHYNLAVFYLQRTPPALELARRHYQKALDLGAAPDAEVAKQLEQQPVSSKQ
jgi:Flp pilus assembly protein TadD